MSKSKVVISDTLNKKFKVDYRDYLTNEDEPEDKLYYGASAEPNADLITNSYYQRHRFRRTAKRLREDS